MKFKKGLKSLMAEREHPTKGNRQIVDIIRIMDKREITKSNE